MRDLIILSLIIVFWGGYILITSLIIQDSVLFNQEITSNVSYGMNTEGISGNISDMPEEIYIFQDKVPSKTTSFLSTIGKMFAFGVVHNENEPPTLYFMLSIINYMCLILLGLIIYRQIRSGAG